MKVLLLDQIPEVNNKYTFSLARGIKKNDVDISVCGIETDDVSAYSDINYLPIFGNYSNISNPIKKVISYKKSFKAVYKYCVENKIDIVHMQWYIFSPFDFHYMKKLQKHGIKVITTIHDLIPFDSKFYDKYYIKKIYQQADAVISQAKSNETDLINVFNVQKNKITYIPHGHYMDFAEKCSRSESRKHLGINDDEPIILFFGQIKKVKGLNVLIDAMRKVVKEYPTTKCIIAGKVWKDDFSIYQKQIKDNGLENNIRADIKFIPDEDIKYYFNASDIVALPYLKSYQSGVALLAYAYEKPVVATNEGEFANMVKDKETGLLVNTNDADSFAKALCWYLSNPSETIEFGKRGRQDLYKRFSWDTIGEAVVMLYKKNN